MAGQQAFGCGQGGFYRRGADSISANNELGTANDAMATDFFRAQASQSRSSPRNARMHDSLCTAVH